MLRNIVLLAGALASSCAGSLFAQDAVLQQKYGRGVHAYFAGDAVAAYEQLTSAIQGGSKDPRAYYFRGLAYLKLGRPQEAAVDFQKGAELESSDVNKFYNVAKSLERVQGAPRVTLEHYRIEARMAALEYAERLRKARYEAIRRDEQRVLREQAIIATPAPSEAAAKDAEAPSRPAETVDAFAAPEKKAAPQAVEADPFSTAPVEKAIEKKPAAEEKKPAKPQADPADPFAS